jgi:superfamily II DNA or RNA helicase
MLLDGIQRDPWWTNLWFFNSLKELFNTISLFQSDIPRYINRLVRRDKLPERFVRKLPMELTSRRENSEIPETLKKLETPYAIEGKNEAIDVCLASNIIEVGVDIDRLSLMTVVSQPKSTAQYIQVTGRVGRRPDKRPGLVVVIYALGRPRDLSHFEHFRSYHERLYAQVEPTSVTPFSSPVVKRGLRGAITAFLRMNSAEDSRPSSIDSKLLKRAFSLFNSRANLVLGVSEEEKLFLRKELETIEKELDRWQPSEWEGDSSGFLIRQGLDQDIPDLKWRIPMSMRSVDAGTGFNITTKYHD